MPRASRLSREALESFFRGRPRRIAGVLFDLTYLPADDTWQAACVVSKKTAPKAVDRNRVRRRARAALSRISSSLKPFQLVFTAKKASVGASFSDTEAEIRSLVIRADVSYNGRI